MAELKIAVPGLVFLQPELSTSQVPVALGASGTFAVSNNIATLTFTAAHNLTFTPAAGVMPNYFVQLSGASAMTGTGTLNGPIFRILAIPSATTIQIYTTVASATVTGASATPVFIPLAQSTANSGFAGGPLAGTPGAVTPGNLPASSFINYSLGPNCTLQYNPDGTSVICDQTTGPTPSVAPVFRTFGVASSAGQIWMDACGAMGIFASGGAGTSRVSVVL